MSFLIATQPVVLAPGEGTHLNVLGNVITLLVSREQTKGAFSVMTQTTPPGGGTPLHTQKGSGRDNCLKLHDKDSKSWLV